VRDLFKFLAILTLLLGWLFRDVLLHPVVVFSNDGPLGTVVMEANRFPQANVALWDDLHWLGGTSPTPFNFSAGFRSLCFMPDVTLLLALAAAATLIVVLSGRVRWARALGGWCFAVAAANLILLVAMATGLVDAYTSDWMAVIGVSLFLMPWLMMFALASLPVQPSPEEAVP
jgi:hypothetical protein